MRDSLHRYLRILAKPVSDLILNGTDPVSVPQQTLLNNGGGILRRDIAYIESVLGACTCSAAANATGEPYATLLKSTSRLPNPTDLTPVAPACVPPPPRRRVLYSHLRRCGRQIFQPMNPP